MHGSVVLTETSLYSKDCTLEKQTGVLGTWIALSISVMYYRFIQIHVFSLRPRLLCGVTGSLASGFHSILQYSNTPLLQQGFVSPVALR